MIIRYLGGCKICFDSISQVSLPQQDQVLHNFCLCSCINNSCMEVESVWVTYNRLVVSKAEDFIIHMSHMIYFSKTNENKSSENDPLLDILSLIGDSPNPLSMILISNMRHSQASSCISPIKKLLLVDSCNFSVYTSCALGVLCAVLNKHSEILPSTQWFIYIFCWVVLKTLWIICKITLTNQWFLGFLIPKGWTWLDEVNLGICGRLPELPHSCLPPRSLRKPVGKEIASAHLVCVFEIFGKGGRLVYYVGEGGGGGGEGGLALYNIDPCSLHDTSAISLKIVQ